MALKEKFRSFIANLFGANALAEENAQLKATVEELRTLVSELTADKASLIEEVDNARAEGGHQREEKESLLVEKQACEERLRKLAARLGEERERKEDAEEECATLRRKCAALEANVDSLSDQLAGLSAANAELTRAKADLEVSNSLAEAKVVEHMREKTLSERHLGNLAAENRQLSTENTEMRKAYGKI